MVTMRPNGFPPVLPAIFSKSVQIRDGRCRGAEPYRTSMALRSAVGAGHVKIVTEYTVQLLTRLCTGCGWAAGGD